MLDRSIDTVAYQAIEEERGEVLNVIIEQHIKITQPTGGIEVPSLYVSSDLKAVDKEIGRGKMRFSFGKLLDNVRHLLPPNSFPLLHSLSIFHFLQPFQRSIFETA